MPYSIFFKDGYAIHGSYEISRLGRPASHGCIRLHPKNAAVLFALVQANMKDTEIVVTGEGVAQSARSRSVAPRARGDERRRRSFEDIFGATPSEDSNADRARQRWENRR